MPRETWLQDESFAYPNGGQTRKGAAIYPDGKVRRVWAGIPDTFFSIPAHGRIRGRYVAGHLTVADWMDVENGKADAEGQLLFRPYARYLSA